ncbi:translational activator GCN1, putative [Plasmodium yoelii]|uniref:Translational activator GCN1 n=2 Tax=Plasmodium yoelii TaxID=5861 RepID=A0AAE9X207_PLAYO|nr:translational activator GCN1, putative [Plasmodium yoelii]WBY60604.1 translational activator GCN1 [Plasmodium yoelii yoelii]CDU20409.1 conserved Plasmodium protein, unknown function [Plasmodium yoelii]VTZ81369.1 translational activator GCN1, putative [Plasmodium yoelii]|eukprot:XP_022812811.1 translational activator GCN1, putative [Plasmodium yoelii]
MEKERTNIEEIYNFIYFKDEIKRDKFEYYKDVIKSILCNNNEEEIVEFVNLLFFTKDINYIKNNLSICLDLLSKVINELDNEKLKNNLYMYILKRINSKIHFIDNFNKALVCKKIFFFCSEYENLLKDIKELTSFNNLFISCLEFLDNLFYSNDKLEELNTKYRLIKKNIIKQLIRIFVNIGKNDDIENDSKGVYKLGGDEEILEGADKRFYNFLQLCNCNTNGKGIYYIVVEAFGQFLNRYNNSYNYINDNKRYIKILSQGFINLLNSNKEILLKINKSFKYIFQAWNDENIFGTILNNYHRYDEVALKNASAFYYYCDLYNKDHLNNLLEIVINLKKNKNLDNCDILYFIIFYKFHINNDNDIILKKMFENSVKLNLVKFNEKIIFLKSVKYLLSMEKSKEIKDIVLSNKNMIIKYLKNDLNEDVQLEALSFLRTVSCVLKNDKEIYSSFSNSVFEIMEKFGKTNEKFLYEALLYYIGSVNIIDTNEKFLTYIKNLLNLCLTKQILKYIFGTNLFLLLLIKSKHISSVKNINSYITEGVNKSIYNKDDIFYLYDINEIKNIPSNKFFFYLYSLLLLLEQMVNDDKSLCVEYMSKVNKDFVKYICFDEINSMHFQNVLFREINKKNKIEDSVTQASDKIIGTGSRVESKKSESNSQIEGKKGMSVSQLGIKQLEDKNKKLDNLHVLIFGIIFGFLNYLEKNKYDKKSDIYRKAEKSFQGYTLSLKNDKIINEGNNEYQNYVEDFEVLLDILLMKKEIYELFVYHFYIYLYMYWDTDKYRNNNTYVLKKFIYILFSYAENVEMDQIEKENIYMLLFLCFCHEKLYYKNMKCYLTRRRMKNVISRQVLNKVNLDTVLAFILKGSNYYNNKLHKKVCFNMIESLCLLKDVEINENGFAKDRKQKKMDDYGLSHDNKIGIKKKEKTICHISKKNIVDTDHDARSNGRILITIKDDNIKNKLIVFTTSLIDILDEKSVKNINEDEIEICKCQYNTLYSDRNVYQATVAVENKNIKRNKHLFSMYDEETAELIMEEELNKIKKQTNTNSPKNKKGVKGKGLTKEDLEIEEIKKQNIIRKRVYEIIERNKYILNCIKEMSYISDIFNPSHINIFIKKIMIFLKNDLTSRYSQKYLNVIIDNMISTKMLICKNKITRCLYNISKYNKGDDSAILIFSSFNINKKISYVLTLFLFPIILNSINIINDKDSTLNILKTLDILLYSKTKINDGDIIKCLQICFDKYPDLDTELESFLYNFNSYLLNQKNIKQFLQLCVTDNEQRRFIIIKSLHKFVIDNFCSNNEGDIYNDKSKESIVEMFNDEFIHLYINIFKNDYNKDTQKMCQEILSKLNIAPVSDQSKLIDSLQKECYDFQDMVCKTIAFSIDKKNTKDLILQLTSKYIIFKEYGKIGILKTIDQLAKCYYINVIDNVEFILNFLLGLCLEEKADIGKIKDYVILCGTSVINKYNEYLLKCMKRYQQNGKGNKSGFNRRTRDAMSISDDYNDEENSCGSDFLSSDDDMEILSNCRNNNGSSKKKNNKNVSKELFEESFKKIYNVLNKYRDNKKSKNKTTVDLIVVMFYGCLGSNLKKESLELLNKLIEQILHRDTDNFTQIEISNIIPKFIENLMQGNNDDEEDENGDIEYNINGENNKAKGVSIDDKTGKNNKKNSNNNVDGKDNKKKAKNAKKSSITGVSIDSLIYLEKYDVSLLIENIFKLLISNKELKVRKGCCLLLGSVIKAHGMGILKSYNILDKINSNINSEDIIKRQSFYLTYGCLFKVLKHKFEPYILKNFNLLLECYKDNVNNIRVLGINVVEEILNDIGIYGLKKIMPFIIFNLKNQSIKSKDIIAYLDILHLIISKFDIINNLDNETLVSLINTLCELVSDTNAKVKEICIKIFNKLEKNITNMEIKNISRQLLLCIYSPNDNHLCDFLDMFASISFEYKINNISLCLLFPIIKKGINNIRLDIKKKSLQIFYFLIHLVNDQSLFIIYFDSIFKTLAILLNDAIPEIRYLTAKSVGNISQFLDINKKLYYIQYIFNILLTTSSLVEKSGASLCLCSILSKCSESIAYKFISKMVRMIDVKKYIEAKNIQLKKSLKENNEKNSKGKKGAENKELKGKKKKKNATNKIKMGSDYSEDDEDYSEEIEDDENSSEESYESISEEDEEDDVEDEDGDEENEEEDMSDNSYEESDFEDDYENEFSEESEKEEGSDYDEEYDDDDAAFTDEMSENNDELLNKGDKDYYLNGYYLIEKNEDNSYCLEFDDDLINWKLIYDKKVINSENSKEGLIGFFIYMPECEPYYTEKFLKKIFQKLMLCLNDNNEKIRDITLRACKVLINAYSKNNTSLILKFIENKIYNRYWRIRKDSVLLLNILIEKNLEINKEEKDIGRLHVLHERFYFMLSLICIMKNDKNINVRQTSYNIYKNFVNKRILQEMWPILLKKITQNLSSKNNSKQYISALALGDLVFKTDSNSLNTIIENMIKDFKTTKNLSIKKGVSLGFYEIFSKGKFNNLIVNYIHDIIYMIKELACNKNASDIIKLLSLLLVNIDKHVLKDIINELVNTIVNNKKDDKNSTNSSISDELISFKSIKFFLNIHTDLVIDYLVSSALTPPYNFGKLKLLSYVSYAKLDSYSHLFIKIIHIFIGLIFFNLKDENNYPYDTKNYSNVELSYNSKDSDIRRKINNSGSLSESEKEINKFDPNSSSNNDRHANSEIYDNAEKDPKFKELYKYKQENSLNFEEIIICLKLFLKNINERNIDSITEILFSELKKYDCKIDLSYSNIEKYKCEETCEDKKSEGIYTLEEYSKVIYGEKLNELKDKCEYANFYGKVREIILSILKYLLDIINEGDICSNSNEHQTQVENVNHGNTIKNVINKKKHIRKKINILNEYRIETYLTALSKYAFVDINKNVLEIACVIYMYLIELVKKIDSSYSYIDTFYSIINKYSTDSNFNEIPDDKYELVGLNLNKPLFSTFINLFTNVILLSPNSDIKIKAIDTLRKLFLYTNKEISSGFILKTSGALIRILTNKYIEQAKIYIFSTFEVLIKKGSNYIKPLIPQLQTCIIKSLNNEKLKKPIIHILNIISEKKLTRGDLLVNDLLNNINVQISLHQSMTILMVLSNILNNSDLNIKNILNKIITCIKPLFNHANNEISFYSCKIYVLLCLFHAPNKKQYLEGILPLSSKDNIEATTHYFMLHLSEVNNFYDILKKDNLLDNFKTLYINMLKDGNTNLQNIIFQIFYNLSKCDDDCLIFIFNNLNLLKLPPFVMISIEIHRYYFKAIKNIFKKKPDIYMTNIPNFLIVIENLLMCTSTTIHAFKLLGERCAYRLFDIGNKNQYDAKMTILKEKLEDKKYSNLVDYINTVLVKKGNVTDSE